MSQSVLSRRIDICKSISTLNKDGCLDVIQSLVNVMRVDITKIFMACSNNWTIDQIIQFENDIKQNLSNQKHHHSRSESRKDKSITNINNKHIKFPLLCLPIDLITQTSLYLNEKDIFEFECCCRLFYQMINNKSYLNLSNNFKTFTITNETLNQMSQTQCSFFKYCKCKHVQLDCHSDVELEDGKKYIKKCFAKLRSNWDKAKQVCMNQGWFNNMFKSIEILDINDDSMVLLDKLPIALLFDPVESHLNSIEFGHYWNESDQRYLTRYINTFETEYLQFQCKLEEQGKEIRKLTRAVHSRLSAAFEGPSYMSVEHLHIDSLTTIIDLNKNWLSPHFVPNLQKLTCDYNIRFKNKNVRLSENKENTKNINIETLRLRYFNDHSSDDICNDNIVIEALNLQNSLKNFMLKMRINRTDNQSLNKWQNVIESIVKKEHFYKLENFIILLNVEKKHIDWVFKMLKKNVQLLKYQFKQFIIGLHVADSHYHVLEWNTQIDKKYLAHLESLWKRNNEKQEIRNQMQDKYWLLVDKWSG